MNSFRILMVEDEDLDAELLQTALEEMDWPDLAFSRVYSLGDAMEELSRSPYSAILLDLDLPDGYAVHSLLRVARAAGTAPIVALSEEDDPDLATACIREGAHEFLPKSEIEPRRLARALRIAAERNRQTLDHRRRSATDAMTGLATERGLSQIWDYLRQPRSSEWFIARLRLAGLNRVYETLGNPEGEVALLDAAAALEGSGGHGAVVSRLGDDEFAVIAPNLRETRDAIEAAVNALRARFASRQDSPPLRCLLGIADLSESSSLRESLEIAAHAMCENDFAIAAGA